MHMSSAFSREIDAELVERARRGDMSAHRRLFEAFAPAVFTLARRLLRHADVAEDVLQETFLDVMRRIGSYRGEAPFGFWLRQIAVNRCLMYLRAYWTQNVHAAQDGVIEAQAVHDRFLERVDVLSLLERLPPEGRAVLWLHEVEGYTHQEIGAMFGKTASFSKSQLARSHARLREMVMNESCEVKACTPIPGN